MKRLEVHIELEREAGNVHLEAKCAHFPLVVLGPSGAGKTTLLECLAGLTRPARGRIAWGERTFFDAARRIDVPPEARRLGYVMQDGALFPHCSVRDNVLFGVRRGSDHSAALQLLDELGIGGLSARRPHTISGGERTRAALARALATEPDLLLLDEPFAALDPVTRQATQHLLQQVLAARALPAVLVTHDRNEALALGAWTWLVLHGRLVQAGPPGVILRRPATHAAAQFVGAENFVPGRVIASEAGICRLRCHGQEFHASGSLAPGTPVVLCVRPEDILLARPPLPPTSARNVVTGRVVGIEPRGALCSIELATDFARWRALVTGQAVEDLDLRAGTVVTASFKATAAHLLERADSRRE